MAVRFLSKIRLVLAVLVVLEVIQLLYTFGGRSDSTSRWIKPMLMFMSESSSEESVSVVPPSIVGDSGSNGDPVKEHPGLQEQKEPPVQEIAKEEPAKVNPAKEDATKEEATKENPAKENPTKEEPAKQEPAKENPAKENPVKENPAKENPAKENPTKEEPSKEDPDKEKPKANASDEENSKGGAAKDESTDEEFKKVEYENSPESKGEGSESAKENTNLDGKVEDNKVNEKGSSKPKVDSGLVKQIKDLTFFFNDLKDFKIDAESIKGKYKESKAHEKFAGNSEFAFTKEYLENVLDIPEETYKKLKDSHTRYVQNHIPKLLKNVNTFGNALKSDNSWSDYEKSNGYVLIGGDKYSWLSYLVIRQLRATGAEYPVELFIPTEKDYDEEFCNTILPKYNARCNIFDYELTKKLKVDYGMGGYQYKMLALLSSRFENVLYLDSDNFPARNPDYLFSLTLFKDKGLILWPDAWSRTTNPKFFDIAGVKVSEKKVRYSKFDKAEAKRQGLDDVKPLDQYTFKDSNYHDFEGTLPNPTSETGMLLINKTSHLKTLLLCLYYNVFGPHFYYPLMTQGSAGEGDKETFIAAAHVMNQTYYQTAKGFRWTGYVNKEKDSFQSKALAHHDPVQCLEKTDDSVDILFMHLSYPKFYPGWLADNNDLIYKDLKEHIRMYASINKNVGYDFDLRVLQFFTQAVCKNFYDKVGSPIDNTPNIDSSEYMGEYLSYVGKDEEANTIKCENVFIPHLKWLKETVKDEFKEKSVIT